MPYIQYKDIIKLAKKALPAQDIELFTPFAKGYYYFTVEDDLLGCSNQDLFARVYAHFELLKNYREKSLIQLFNPTVKWVGYDSDYSALEIVAEDRSFLVDSLQMLFARLNLSIYFVVHPIYSYDVDDQGQITQLYSGKVDNKKNLSVIHIEFDRLPEEKLEEVKKEVIKTLNAVTQVTDDWSAMTQKMVDVTKEIQGSRKLPQPNEEIAEATRFLSWLEQGHFTFLGYRRYELRDNELYNISETGLGVLRAKNKGAISNSFASLPDHLKKKATEPNLLLFSKSNNLSIIHRPVYMDFIGVKYFDDQGNVLGEHRFLGLLTITAYQLMPRQIPLLSHKINKIIESVDLPMRSHAAKEFEHVLSEFPRDELFQADILELTEMAMGIFYLRDRAKLKFFARIDSYETYISCFIFIPKDRYNTKTRIKIEKYLVERFNGHSSEFSAYFNERVHVRVSILIRTTPGEINSCDYKQIEQDLSVMIENWDDGVNQRLVKILGQSKGNGTFKTFEQFIPVAYKEKFSPDEAASDLLQLSELNESQQLQINLYRKENDSLDKIRLKLYGQKEVINLTDVLPVLEHFGFVVNSATPYQFSLDEESLVWIVDFDMRLSIQTDKQLCDFKDHFAEAFLNTWTGIDESDHFDKLVISNGLSPRDITVLRAISKYMIQAKAPFSKNYIQSAINKNTDIASLLIDLFYARMQPGKKANRKDTQKEIIQTIEGKLEQVTSLDEDRIIRWFIDVISAMLRTNFFQKDKSGLPKNYLSFKLDSQKIKKLPLPKPMFEIFVYSTLVEGIHLRGGKVARGGLRWSDRMGDFRTEVLGLVKAQIVKNAVIVPVGSKGGFIVKRPDHSSREAFLEEGIRCYKTFISGLLDLTDNIVSKKIVPPKDVYRHDSDDPYLVVAADKGTASFSDIANGIAKEYGFWLGDAFASGGSVGYDHKGMGITARGAWESVKRHFRHLGKDIQKETFSVVGIGDMGGDVFGNGMLLSEKILLKAAFNHLHIFIDPDPIDSAESFKERKRLFETPKTSWDDYNRKLISKGGGVFLRSDKSIKITQEMKEAFALTDDSLSPTDLIHQLLKAPVELLWNGGIGTYVKSSEESHEAVGDKANDSLRVNGADLNCKVIGEGGNLGLTQLGRIEFAKKGGLILTDAIDNSAGVNCSDHEVNIKILLNQAIESGKFTVEERNKLLASMTDDVAQLVLRQNYQQPQAISISASQSSLFLDHVRIMRKLEQAGRLNREIEFLPDDKEIKRREAAGEGLYQPELAVLLAYSKINLFDDLLASSIPDAGLFQEDLKNYFPAPLRDKYIAEMQSHPLHREIVATFLTNSLLNHMGPVFMTRCAEESGQTSDQILLAYCAARNIFSARKYWKAIDELDNKVDANLQNKLHLHIRDVLEKASMWFLVNRRDNIDIQAIEKEFSSISKVSKLLPKVLNDKVSGNVCGEIDKLIAAGVSKSLATELVYLPYLIRGLDVIELTNTSQKDLESVMNIFVQVAEKLNTYSISKHIRQLYNNDYWMRRACNSLMQSLMNNLVTIAKRIISKDSKDPFVDWMEQSEDLLARYLECTHEIKNKQADLPRLSVIIGELSELARNS